MRTHRALITVAVVSSLLHQTVVAQELPYDQHENIVYAETDGIGLVMDVFTPKGRANGLGIVDVISGAWHSDRGKIRDHARAQTFRILCGKGYTVFAVRPGSISKFSVAEMIANLNQGVRWVKDHSNDYGIDPDRLGMMGASAGGHLACLAAVTAKDEKAESAAESSSGGTRVAAVAVFFPPTDFLNYNGKAIDPRADDDLSRLVRRLAFPQKSSEVTESDVTRLLTQVSPARLVTPQAPPFLLIHGDADQVVPLQQSELMLAALKNANVSAELIVKPGGGHPWLTIHEEVQVIADWFDKQLGAAAALPADPARLADAQARTKADESIRAAVESVLRNQEDAWNRGDIDAFMDHYWRSEALTFSSGGKTTRGWTETLNRYRERYPTQEKMGRLRLSELEMIPLSDSAALVLGQWSLERESDPVSGNFSLVVRKFNERWLIVHDHTSRTSE